MSENNSSLNPLGYGASPGVQIATQPYGDAGVRRAIAAKNKMPRYDDLCATHGVTGHLTKNGQCATCARIAEPMPSDPRRAARRLRAKTYLGQCATHGAVVHDTRRGLCQVCFTTDGYPRAATTPNPRADARRAGQTSYVAACVTHGSTAHSVLHGKCLTCFTSTGTVRRWVRV